MRHRVNKKTFGKLTKHRAHLLKNLVMSLLEHGHIETTKPRAKETKRLADKLIGQAQDGSVATRRKLHKFFGKRQVVNRLVDEVAPAMADRKSGYSRVVDQGRRRGDNTEMARLELIKQPQVKQEEKQASKKTQKE